MTEKERELFIQVRELKEEVATLKLLHGDLSSEQQSWLQMKCASQRKALDILNRKVLTQRFRLRIIGMLGRDLTREEYETAKAELENEQVKDRILEYV